MPTSPVSHVTEDGRTSLKQLLFRNRAGNASLLGGLRSRVKPEVMPLAIILTGAIALAGGFSAYQLTRNPDIQINKLHRKQTVREHFDEGKKWVKHHESVRKVGPQYIRKPTSPTA